MAASSSGSPGSLLAVSDDPVVLREWLAAIVSSSDDAIYSKDLDGTITTWNKGAERLYGYRADEVVGRHISVLIPSDRAGEEIVLLDRIAAGDRVDHYETVRVTKNGALLEVAVTISGIRGSSGEVIGASVIARDLTEQKRALEEIEKAHREAERTNRAKSDFLSRMSHELRTPLSAIVGFGELLKGTHLDQEQREFVDHLRTGGEALRALINEVLDISRIEAGQFRLSLEPVTLINVLSESVSLVGPLAAQREITLDIGNLSDIESIHVAADRQRLSQVFLNLLSNAVKYNVHGGSVTVRATPSEQGTVRVAVADTGPGIEQGKLHLVFEPFERLNADDTQVEGTGLGLSVARGLVEAMGGRLSVDSALGRGTVFYVELKSSNVDHRTRTLGDIPPASDTAEAGGSGLVLYIEDNHSNIRLVKGLLRRRPNVELISASTGAAGLEMARTRSPDLILLDLHLPDATGDELLAILRRDPITHETPTVILSADAFTEHMERLSAAGADGYLTKPLDFDRFLDTIDQFITAEEEDPT